MRVRIIRFLVCVVAILSAAGPGAFAQEDTIKVGVLHSLSGTMAISETTLKDTMLFLIDEQNKKGGLLGKKLEAVVVDPASDWPLFAEKARELISVNKVSAVFGCWTSVSRKSVLPVFEELNNILFYPVQYEGEESQRNVFYTGAAPNQQAIPAVDYLMNEEGVERWVLAGTDYVYPRTTNKILEAYLQAKGVAAEDIMINYTPFGHSDWQTIVSDIKKFGSAGKKTAVVSTINGDANVPFYKELGNQGVKAEDIPVVALSVGEEELASIDTAPLVGHLTAWNYFQSIDTPENQAFIEGWRSFTGNRDKVTSDPMAATYLGFNMWVKAVEKAGTTDSDAVIDALIGVSVPNLTGGYSTMMPNHTVTKPAFVGAIEADGQISVVWETPRLIVGDEWSDFLADSKYLVADWRGPVTCGVFDVAAGTCEGTGAEEKVRDERFVSLLFATNRTLNTTKPRIEFTADRSKELVYGAVQVRIPDRHDFGSVERFQPSFFKWLFRQKEDPRVHFILNDPVILTEDNFRSALADSTTNDVLLFVPGYNNDFVDGAFRIAQIVWDTQYKGVPILFSWPSVGGEVDYFRDYDSAIFTIDGFTKLICDLRRDFPGKNIDIVGHSMGGHIVIQSLKRTDCEMKLDQVVLAAPDVDKDVFLGSIALALAKTNGLTVYASANDKAMAFSRGARVGAPRVGDVINGTPVVTGADVAGIDAIDVSALGEEFLGLNHTVFASSITVANDMSQLILSGIRPPTTRTPVIVAMPDSKNTIFFRFPN